MRAAVRWGRRAGRFRRRIGEFRILSSLRAKSAHGPRAGRQAQDRPASSTGEAALSV
jgi:hypothetical protein